MDKLQQAIATLDSYVIHADCYERVSQSAHEIRKNMEAAEKRLIEEMDAVGEGYISNKGKEATIVTGADEKRTVVVVNVVSRYEGDE